MTNAERQKAYRERKKKAKQEAVKTSPLDLQAPIDPAPESAMQVKEPFITQEMEVVYETAPKPDPEFQPRVEPLTVFDVLQRRMEREAKR